MARVTNSVFSSWIDQSLSSIFSLSSAFGVSNLACVPALERSLRRILHAPTLSSVALRVWFSGSVSASGPQIRMLSWEIS
jgi:hypothetical protein